ncbi:MAG: oligosaccharide flippase family protein, partial [Vicinamibacterales bacterium]
MTAAPTASLPETRQSRTQSSVVASALTLFSGQLAIKVVAFVFSVVVIRHLGSAEYGKYAICVAFGGLFTVLSDLGLATLAVKRIARDQRETPDMFSNVLALRLVLASLVVVATSLTAWIVGYDPEIRLGILIASFGLLAYALHGSIDAVVMGHERFRFSASLAVATQVVTLALAAALVFGGAGFLGLLIAATLGALLVALVALWRLRRVVPLRGPVTPSSWGGMTRAAMPFAATTLALAVSYRVDAVILS